MILCNKDGKIEVDDTCDIWLEYSYVDMRCHVIDGIAGCVFYDDDGIPETCHSPSETIICNDDHTIAYHQGCGLAEDGQYYVRGDYDFSEFCVATCEDGKGCVEIPEEERCDPATFIQKCDNNQIVSCINGRIQKTACVNGSCHAFAATGIAACTDETCSISGTSLTCEYTPDENGEGTYDYAIQSNCAQAEDGNFYAYPIQRDFCSFRCDPVRGCVNPVKGEGSECNEATFEQRCQDNGAVFCDGFSNLVDVIYCHEGFTCLTETDKDTNDAGCYDNVTSLCDHEGERQYKCTTSGNFASMSTYICKTLSDGKRHYTFDDFESCSNGCDNEGIKCK